MPPYGPRKEWYQKQGNIALLLIFFFPLGLLLMWLYTPWSKKAKWIITGIFAFFTLIGGIINSSAEAQRAALMDASATAQAQPTATPMATPTPKPTPSPTPEPTPTPTSVPTEPPAPPPAPPVQEKPASAPPPQEPAPPPPAPPVYSGDKDCSDFSTQAEAQAYFESKGGSASNNVDDCQFSEFFSRFSDNISLY